MQGCLTASPPCHACRAVQHWRGRHARKPQTCARICAPCSLFALRTPYNDDRAVATRASKERAAAPRGTQRTGKLIDIYLFAGSLVVVVVLAVASQANQARLFSQVQAGKSSAAYRDPASRADWAAQEAKDVRALSDLRDSKCACSFL